MIICQNAEGTRFAHWEMRALDGYAGELPQRPSPSGQVEARVLNGGGLALQIIKRFEEVLEMTACAL